MLNRAALASLLVAAAAASARADVPPEPAPATAAPGAEEDPPAVPPVAAAAAPAAPQNEAWSNVSHINGTPVPVGDRNRYLYTFKRTNVAVNPFGPFLGYYDASATFAVSQNLALSVSGTAWDLSNDYRTGYQVAATMPIYFRRTFSGPYLEPGLMLRSTHDNVVYDCFDDCSGFDQSPSRDWAGIEMLFGWQWIFDSGLNVQFAFGVAKHLAANHDEYSNDTTEANGYFRVGYAF